MWDTVTRIGLKKCQKKTRSSKHASLEKKATELHLPTAGGPHGGGDVLASEPKTKHLVQKKTMNLEKLHIQVAAATAGRRGSGAASSEKWR